MMRSHSLPILASLLRVLAATSLVGCEGDSVDTDRATYQEMCARKAGCPADGDETENQCLNVWRRLLETCPTEGQRLIDCAMAQPDETLVCNDGGQTDIPEAVCASERDAALACAN